MLILNHIKNIATIISILLLTCATACAQIVNIEDQTGQIAANTYYKDTHNLLNPFVGTYVFSNGGNEIKFVFVKKVMSNVNNIYNEDILIGEFQYIENGNEISNTLFKLNNTYTDGWMYSMKGNTILSGNSRGCSDCNPNEKRLEISVNDEARDRIGRIILRKVIQGGQEAIAATITWSMRVYNPEYESPTTELGLPSGTYVLIKQ